MARTDQDTIALLDLGTAKTTILVVRVRDGRLRYAGHASVESKGTRKGLVVSLDAAVSTIRSAAEEVERRTGQTLDRVFLSLTGAHVRGLSGQAGISLTSRSREISRDDMRRVLNLARSVSMPDDREIVHVMPQEFVLDNQPGIHDPTGMLATRMEARVYMVTVSAGAKRNLVLAANRAGLEVEEVIFAPLAVSETCLPAEEREAGVAVVELGAGSTGILAFLRGSVHHAGSIPIGGDHFTNDIAVGFNTTPREAERIKRTFGVASGRHAHGQSMIEVPGLGNRPARMLPHERLGECIEPRARELIRLIREDLNRAGLMGALGAGLVLSGGGARMAGFQELAESELNVPVRLAIPSMIDGMPEEFAEPEQAFLVGATYYGHRILRRYTRPPNVWERIRLGLGLSN